MFTLQFGSYTFPNQTFELQELPLDNDIREEKIPRKHGAIVSSPFIKTRRIKIKGFIHNDVVETSHTQLMEMQEGLLAGEEQFKYRSDRYINCYLRKINPKPQEGTDKAVIEISIDLVAQVPFFYSDTAYSIAKDITGTTHVFDVSSGGNVFSEPVISICATGGTIDDDIQLENITNANQLFKFRGIVANGETLEIDSSDLTVENNALDGISNFEGDFITLLAGSNEFQYVGADARVTVDYRYRWY